MIPHCCRLAFHPLREGIGIITQILWRSILEAEHGSITNIYIMYIYIYIYIFFLSSLLPTRHGIRRSREKHRGMRQELLAVPIEIFEELIGSVKLPAHPVLIWASFYIVYCNLWPRRRIQYSLCSPPSSFCFFSFFSAFCFLVSCVFSSSIYRASISDSILGLTV